MMRPLNPYYNGYSGSYYESMNSQNLSTLYLL